MFLRPYADLIPSSQLEVRKGRILPKTALNLNLTLQAWHLRAKFTRDQYLNGEDDRAPMCAWKLALSSFAPAIQLLLSFCFRNRTRINLWFGTEGVQLTSATTIQSCLVSHIVYVQISDKI